jgi:hypothetical protein
MADAEPKDPNQEHDEKIARGRDHAPLKLTEAGNKAPPADVPFKVGASK